jgi:hypothetical protein
VGAGSGTSDADEQATADSVTCLPSGPDTYNFLAAHSPSDDPELLAGLCLYAEVFLTKVSAASFIVLHMLRHMPVLTLIV